MFKNRNKTDHGKWAEAPMNSPTPGVTGEPGRGSRSPSGEQGVSCTHTPRSVTSGVGRGRTLKSKHQAPGPGSRVFLVVRGTAHTFCLVVSSPEDANDYNNRGFHVVFPVSAVWPFSEAPRSPRLLCARCARCARWDSSGFAAARPGNSTRRGLCAACPARRRPAGQRGGFGLCGSSGPSPGTGPAAPFGSGRPP